LQVQSIRIKDVIRGEILGGFDNISIEPGFQVLTNLNGLVRESKTPHFSGSMIFLPDSSYIFLSF